MKVSEPLFLSIGGMSCANCARGIEKSLSRIEGIEFVRVYLAEESAEISFDSDKIRSSEIIKRIVELGFEGKPIGTPIEEQTGLAAILFTALLAIPVFSMAMFGADNWPNRFSQMVLSGIILTTTGRRFFTGAARSLASRSANMDVLVAMGVGAAWGYSALVMMFPSIGHGGMIHFETSAVLVLFILFGKMLETRARHKATASLRSLTRMQQAKARRVLNDLEETIDGAEVKPGDRIRVLPGECFPVDGVIERGEAAADESLLTGESMPVSKGPGATAISGSLNLTGEVLVKANRNGSESTLQALIRTMRRAQADKPPIQRFADRVSDWFVPVVIGSALITGLGWIASGTDWNMALMHSITVLVVACPCALGLATPTAVVVACGIALRRGLLVKKPSALEALASIKFILFDKTGTLTEGTPTVKFAMDTTGGELAINAVRPEPSVNLQCLLGFLGRSIHPLARGAAAWVAAKGIVPETPISVEEQKGFGILGKAADGSEWLIGSRELLEEKKIKVPDLPDVFRKEALTTVFAAREGMIAAIFGLADAPKAAASETIRQLRDRGVEPVMVSGDRPEVASAVGSAVGVTEIRAGVKPEGKWNIVKDYLTRGPVCFVGDGINDAPALSAATVGIAIGSGADAAKEATDLVLPGTNISLLPFAIDLSRQTLRKIRQNLFWAMVYNLLALPLASGVFIPMFGPGASISPELAGLLMALSSVSVVTNSLLLRTFFPESDDSR